MIFSFEANLLQLSVHKVGNKINDEGCAMSENQLDISDDDVRLNLLRYFLSPFEKVNEVYRLYHPSTDVSLNVVGAVAYQLFNYPETFHKNSQNLARLLYDASSHPKIKSGELYVAYFENVQIEGELMDAIGIFKSENRETYLQVNSKSNGFDLKFDQAINTHKLDKGCLIFNTEEKEGYKVAVIDNASSKDAIYWKDDFLQLIVREDNYQRTNDALNICKSFIEDNVSDHFEMNEADKADLLNRSIKYFKEKETFDLEEYSNEVIANAGAIDLFKEFKTGYEDSFEIKIPDSFEISSPAVKKQERSYKHILKLDKNFEINIKGDSDLIQKGFDEDKQLNYYKVFFREER